MTYSQNMWTFSIFWAYLTIFHRVATHQRTGAVLPSTGVPSARAVLALATAVLAESVLSEVAAAADVEGHPTKGGKGRSLWSGVGLFKTRFF